MYKSITLAFSHSCVSKFLLYSVTVLTSTVGAIPLTFSDTDALSAVALPASFDEHPDSAAADVTAIDIVKIMPIILIKLFS